MAQAFHRPWPLLPEEQTAAQRRREVFKATLGFESYAPHVQAPLLWLGATNDFHGIMDDTYRTGKLIPGKDLRYAFTPHMNHRFTPEFAVTRPLWFDQHLKGTFRFPATPDSMLALATEDRVPTFRVTPDGSMTVAGVHLYYSVDPSPQARFWGWQMSPRKKTLGLPNCRSCRWTSPFLLLRTSTTGSRRHSLFRFPSQPRHLRSVRCCAPPRPRKSAVQASRPQTHRPCGSMIFRMGLRIGYTLSPQSYHWQFWTRKLTDPKWRGRPGYRLTVDVKTGKPNELVVVLTGELLSVLPRQTTGLRCRGEIGRRRPLADNIVVAR